MALVVSFFQIPKKIVHITTGKTGVPEKGPGLLLLRAQDALRGPTPKGSEVFETFPLHAAVLIGAAPFPSLLFRQTNERVGRRTLSPESTSKLTKDTFLAES